MSGQIAHAGEGDGGDRHQAGGQPVQAVGEIDRVGRGGDDQDDERHEQDAEVDEPELEERDVRDGGRESLLRPQHQQQPDQGPERDLARELVAAEQPAPQPLDHPQVVVEEAQRPEPDRGEQGDPHRPRVEVAPEQRGQDDGGDDEQPPHRGRALLRQVRLRPLGADPLAQAQAREPLDHRGAQHEADEQRGDGRVGGAERDVAEDVQRREPVQGVERIDPLVEHLRPPPRAGAPARRIRPRARP